MAQSMTARHMALRPGPLAVAWLLTVGVDLFFNAGIFSFVFDQEREPSLLSDPELFRRIPVAYLGLAVGVAALGWLFDRIDLTGLWPGAAIGASAGVVAAFLGIIGLWTAVDMTGLFVAAGSLVQVVEFGAAGAFLGAYRRDPESRRPTRLALAAALALAITAIVAQNVLSP